MWAKTFLCSRNPQGKTILKLISVAALLALLLAAWGAAPSHAIATVRYAVPGGLTSGSCLSWGTACELSYALGAASSGTLLWVKEGTYKPSTAGLTDPREANFTLRNGVTISGGFAGDETDFLQRDPATHVTILSGDIGTPGDSADNTYHVVSANGTNSTAWLDGFTITGGNGQPSGGTGWLGGGIFTGTGSPTLNNLILTGNRAIAGGGLYNYSGSPVLNHVTFSDNHVTGAPNQGGGLMNDGGNVTLTDVTFTGNSAATGGGMMISGGFASLKHVTFTGNSGGYGGGFYTQAANPTLTDVTFNGNSTSSSGSAFYAYGGAPILTNVTISGNTGGAALDIIYSLPEVYNSILWADSSELAIGGGSGSFTLKDSILSGPCPPFAACTHVLDSDPLLDALADNGGLTQTMALRAGSPAIDSGGQNSTCATDDQRYVLRPLGACDMGAYEYLANHISGNAGVIGATLSYEEGTTKTTTSDGIGDYSFAVRYPWTGAVTPSKPYWTFNPSSMFFPWPFQGDTTGVDFLAAFQWASAPWAGSVTITSDRDVVAVGRPHIGGTVASYDAFPSAGLTSYLPMLFKHAFGGAYDSAFYIQDTDPVNPAHVAINFYDNGGNLSCGPISDVIAPSAAKGYWVPSETCLPTGWVGGAVVTSVDSPIVTVGRPHVGTEVMTYDGFTSGTLTAYLPMLFKDAFGGSYDAAFYVQNVDPSGTAHATVKYYDSVGTLICTKPAAAIGPLSTMGIWVPSESCLPIGWVGAAVVTSSDYPIVAVGRPHIGTKVTAYDGFSAGTLASYVPMLFKGAFGGSYDAALYVQNLDPTNSAHVTVKYYNSAGTLSCTKPVDIIAPLASHGYWLPNESCLPNGWVGGAVITSSDSAIVAMARPHVGPQVTTYDGFPTGSLTASAPMLFKGAFGGSYNSALYVQNVDGGGPAAVQLKFYDSEGNTVCTRNDSIPALASLGYWLPSIVCNP